MFGILLFRQTRSPWLSRFNTPPTLPAPIVYRLYISLACPRKSTLIVRGLKGLEQTIGITVVDPVRDELGLGLSQRPRLEH
jgi:glutathionyl-hydroquinone reductase